MPDCLERILSHLNIESDLPCIIESDQTITYAEFRKLVIANALFLKTNEFLRVVINMRQGSQAYSLIIATLLVGGCYCPLNLQSPEDRKIHIITEFQPDVIVSENDLIIKNPGPFPQFSISQTYIQKNTTSTLQDLYEKNPHEIAYVIYTSGSTGDPKGVMIYRNSLNKFLDWSVSNYNCSKHDRWAQYSSLSFDLSIVDIFTALCSGCALVPMADYGYKVRPANSILKHQITIWHSVPGAVDFMISQERVKQADISSLHTMSFCGEPLFEHHLKYLFGKNPKLVIFNTYGPTEGTLFCTAIKLTIDNYKQLCQSNVSIGQPIPGWNFLLKDFEGEEELKQIIIYGQYIGKGYLNKATNNAFFLTLIDGKPEPAYDTGDLVKSVNGELYFVGRVDNQIKLNGNRIELDEIDNWIMRILSKKSVSLVLDNHLHTFIETNVLDENKLRTELQAKIEKYKIPSYFYKVANFPRNTNQKVDRNKLKELINEQGQIYKPL